MRSNGGHEGVYLFGQGRSPSGLPRRLTDATTIRGRTIEDARGW